MPAMSTTKRLRELGLSVGVLPTGPSNLITDVPGVRVGHCDVRGGPIAPGRPPVHSGVSVILPGRANRVAVPLPAAVDVFNGYGKSAGILQIAELGKLESPIFLCNTLNVGRVWDAAASIILEQNPEAVTVNPAVFECNDFRFNDSRSRPVGESHVRAAYAAAQADPVGCPCPLGSVGAGSGTGAFGFKAGIGSSSRAVDTRTFGRVTVGVLSLNNFGGRLRWQGRQILPAAEQPAAQAGSVIVVIAVSAAADSRTLGRLARRAWAGIARSGSNFGHGSGDIAVAFSLPASDDIAAAPVEWNLPDEDLSVLFTAVADATEESVWDALLLGGEATDIHGRLVRGLSPEALLAAAKGQQTT